jgi:hypothetical protein
MLTRHIHKTTHRNNIQNSSINYGIILLTVESIKEPWCSYKIKYDTARKK